ncbi:PLP-dependent aminotransferase family protein [Sphingomonas sp. CROZ-RG-20F-R02-07]|uniref:MocR-like pyridoxine biosynthesis transcription factor PdxR n=1 Tax=Sphingomonas sp. CROZ-RG-20F-R02-07 TaxID=2914832 RepID=UPI001F59AE63|nr:PLP-dependent aminotransferase family protein [Sphingomonas sp. CROZ-RG-20F-R02-07]
MEPIFELSLSHVEGRMTACRLIEELKAAILDGRLAPGAQLPPTRRAQAMFRLSRNTVAGVYERLIHEGLAEARHGSGTFVAARRSAPKTRSAASVTFAVNPIWTDPATASAMDFWSNPRLEGAASATDFRPALVDSRLFPLDILRRVVAREMRRLETRPPSFKGPQGNQGSHRLRLGIARHIAVTRSIAADPSDVVVTAGAQQAFDLLARVLVEPGRTVVAVEDPGYPPMRIPFQAAGARLVAVPVDGEGMRVDLVPPEAGVICVCPSHQFPLGVAMSAERRAALVDYARRRGALIVEDDYDGEFRHEGLPIAALRSAETADVVAYVGTFSKCMLPSLRLGFLMAPEALRPAIVAARNASDWHSPTPMQAGVAAFITDGHLARHVGRLRALYGGRRRHLSQGLESLRDRLTVLPSAYGMHVAATVGDAEGLVRSEDACRRAGIQIHTLRRYGLATPTVDGIVLGIGAADEADIDRLVGILRDTL